MKDLLSNIYVSLALAFALIGGMCIASYCIIEFIASLLVGD